MAINLKNRLLQVDEVALSLSPANRENHVQYAAVSRIIDDHNDKQSLMYTAAASRLWQNGADTVDQRGGLLWPIPTRGFSKEV
jgi:hypothetical protein